MQVPLPMQKFQPFEHLLSKHDERFNLEDSLAFFEQVQQGIRVKIDECKVILALPSCTMTQRQPIIHHQ